MPLPAPGVVGPRACRPSVGPLEASPSLPVAPLGPLEASPSLPFAPLGPLEASPSLPFGAPRGRARTAVTSVG
ncbi:MAG TPA: hypothetical protein VFS43_16550 [Polyangiaceae bacterium]|nr:hypothetical protein [Polyangiaceae bacterium]